MKNLKFVLLFACLLSVSIFQMQNPIITTNSNTAIQTALTHPITYTVSQPPFNAIGYQSVNTSVQMDSVQLDTYPVNVTNENYLGLYSFISDQNGYTPNGWTGSGNAVIQSYVGHTKVVNLTNELTQTVVPITSGTFEFWEYIPAFNIVTPTPVFFFCTHDYVHNGYGIELNIYHSITHKEIAVWNYSAYLQIGIFKTDCWTHFRISFNDTTQNWNLYLNNTYKGTYWYDHALAQNRTVDVSFQETQPSGFSFCDAIDYSWSGGYYLNHNTHIETFTTGDYQGVYSFITDTAGYAPTNWAVTGSIKVVSGIAGHHNVVNCTGSLTNTFNTYHTSGLIEFWVRFNTTSVIGSFVLRHDADAIVYSEIGLNWSGYKDTGTYNIITGIVANHWYHILLNFTTTREDYWIDGTEVGWQFHFTNRTNSLNSLTLDTSIPTFVDAVDYSWADGYVLHRNMQTENFTTNVYNAKGVYCSPIAYLPSCYATNLTTFTCLRTNSIITTTIYISLDNTTWTPMGLGPLSNETNSIPLSAPMNTPSALIFGFNFTSIYGNATSILIGYDFFYEVTIANIPPNALDIAPANNSLNLNILVPINCTVFSSDDSCNISLYINATLVNSASNCANASFFYYLFHASYNTTYIFYFSLTDGENVTVSDLYFFTTGDAPTIPVSTQPATIFDWVVILFGSLIAAAIAVANKKRE